MYWGAIADRWFVRYNPLYFASALCILAGVFLLARELPDEGFGSKVAIVASAEAYQILLIVGAWLLLRAGLTRTAAILGLLAFVFMLDVTFNGERLLAHAGQMSLAPGMRARRALPASFLLALAGPIKVWALSRLFRLENARIAAVGIGLATFALPLLPYLIEIAGAVTERRQIVHLGLFWLGAAFAAWALTPSARAWFSRWEHAEAHDDRPRRIALLIPFVTAALFVAHGLAWITFPGIRLSPAHFAPYALVGGFVWSRRMAARDAAKAEAIMWFGASVALLLGAWGPPDVSRETLAAVAMMTGGMLFALVRLSSLRLLLPATVSVLGSLYLLASGSQEPLPTPGFGWAVAAAVALLVGATWHLDFRCLAASSLAAGASIFLAWPSPELFPFGVIYGGTWFACWGWMLFPELRSWLPMLTTGSVLALSGLMLWLNPSQMTAWYGAAAAIAIAVGWVHQRRDFQSAGSAALALLLIVTRARWAPSTPTRWGWVLVAGGFVLLTAGVAFNLLLARRRLPSA